MSEKRSSLVITDMVDFYRQWPNLRPHAIGVIDACALTEDQIEVLRWMIKVVDMVGPQDITRDK